ncbi:SPARC-related modular calcium-binding protein 1 [Sarcoptes scabiei]|nr:SPARC-related modular calcium-binding protein 1 [Sarcoptes scabiei]
MPMNICVDQNHLVCWENRVDVLVSSIDGQIFALRHDLIWPMVIHNNIDLIALQKPYRNTQIFPNLPSDISMAFTMPLSDNSKISNLFGMTLFLKPPEYYLYRGLKHLRNESIQYWETGPFLDNRFLASLHNTNLILVAKNGLIPDGIKTIIGGQVFMFDTSKFPEWIGVFNVDPKFKNNFDWLKLKQLIPITLDDSSNSNHRYLALLDHGIVDGQFYCITEFDSIESCQNLKAISKAFACSDRIVELKTTNKIHKIWTVTNLNLSLILYGSMGLLLSLTLINYALTINLYDLLKKFSKTSPSNEETESEENDQFSF